jgi:hypothetical protein
VVDNVGEGDEEGREGADSPPIVADSPPMTIWRLIGEPSRYASGVAIRALRVDANPPAHSCTPSLEMVFSSGTSREGLGSKLKTTRFAPDNAQPSLCYADRADDLEMRSEELAARGIVFCKCIRCKLERDSTTTVSVG